MMMYEQHIKQWLAADNGVLVRIEFLDPAGNTNLTLEDMPVRNLLIKSDRVAFWGQNQERPHAFKINSALFELDEWGFDVEDGTIRVYVSPLWLDEQSQMLDALPPLSPENLVGLEEFFNAR